MTGKIMKGIGGFYYVYVEGSGLYECRARGIFRNKKMKPNVGDVVDIDILSEEEKTGNLVKIHKRKNQLIRPMAANVDQALVIFAVHEPEPNFHLLNRFLITMEQQEIPVIICFNKTDLATTEQMQQLEKDYENSGCQVFFQAAATGEGITQIEELLRGKTTIMAGPSGVGKSSTLNCISKEKQMETGAGSVVGLGGGLAMLRAVELDDEGGRGTIKIGDIFSDRPLSVDMQRVSAQKIIP